jgi:hypothetical protein
VAKSDLTAINAKTISVNSEPIPGSAPAVGPYTTFDQLDADIVLALNGVVIQGQLAPGQSFTAMDNVNVLSGVSIAEIVKYGFASTPDTNNGTGPIGIGDGHIPTLPTIYNTLASSALIAATVVGLPGLFIALYARLTVIAARAEVLRLRRLALNARISALEP